MSTPNVLIKAVQRACRKLASSGNFDDLVRDVLVICVQAVGAHGGTIYLHDPVTKRLRFQHILPEEIKDQLPRLDIPDDFGIVGEAFYGRQTMRRDFPEKSEEEKNEFEKATGVIVRSMIASPLMLEDELPIGVVQLLNKKTGEFTDEDAAVLDTISAVSTMAYINFRLTEESARASTLLGMGKVSHDIGNLAASLYANVNFSDYAFKGLKQNLPSDTTDLSQYVDALEPSFEDLRNSIDRIVGYSRLISDMSAGKELRPNFKEGSLAETIRLAASYLESEARANCILLKYDIQEDANSFLHDELYIFRMVQNLVGNAIKAVVETSTGNCDPDSGYVAGNVLVSYHLSEGCHLLEISDDGPGMTRQIAEKILSGTARSQWDKGSGSGWGMKIVLELAATHKAKVEINSELGKGSTFRVSFPC